MIYSLCITTGIDNYKHRGESPSSKTSLHKTYREALESLKNYLKNYLITRKNEYDTEYKLDYVEKSGLKYLFCLTENGNYEFNENVEILTEDISKIHENFCKGEYIPHRWTYEIESHVFV
jgi:hypothetical protein